MNYKEVYNNLFTNQVSLSGKTLGYGLHGMEMFLHSFASRLTLWFTGHPVKEYRGFLGSKIGQT